MGLETGLTLRSTCTYLVERKVRRNWYIYIPLVGFFILAPKTLKATRIYMVTQAQFDMVIAMGLFRWLTISCIVTVGFLVVVIIVSWVMMWTGGS